MTRPAGAGPRLGQRDESYRPANRAAARVSVPAQSWSPSGPRVCRVEAFLNVTGKVGQELIDLSPHQGLE